MRSSTSAAFTFVDLFAGVGGFHAAMKALGGECVYAVEIDKRAARVYEANWGHPALGDITVDADDDLGIMNVPAHDVLCAGFPCQPFSKSGAQRGMDETRGTLFFNIASIIKAHRPKVVLLENVRNLIGPRHQHEYDVIIETLRELGYHVSDAPAVFSPHLLPPTLGGTPQARERVFITATHAPDAVQHDAELGGPAPVATMADRFGDFDPKRDWNIDEILDDAHNIPGCTLSDAESHWISAWNEFVQIMRPIMNDRPLPGFPIWADSWLDFPEMKALRWDAKTIVVPESVTVPDVDPSLPAWKQSHIRKNYDLFARHFQALIPWAHYWKVYSDGVPVLAAQAGVASAGRQVAVGHSDALPAFGHPRQEGELPAGSGRDHPDVHRGQPRASRVPAGDGASAGAARLVHLPGPAPVCDLPPDGQWGERRGSVARVQGACPP